MLALTLVLPAMMLGSAAFAHKYGVIAFYATVWAIAIVCLGATQFAWSFP